MKQHASEQEYIVHQISRHILGQPAVFFPDNYGNSQEPADIAWVANRCAMLMYMTKSGQAPDKKQRHNLRQLHRWMKHWRRGVALTGSVGDSTYSFSFSDIDHVIGLSIVDGGGDWCENHADHVIGRSDDKLSVCATITGTVMEQIARLGFGVRDIVFFLDSMRHVPSMRVSEEEMLRGTLEVHNLVIKNILNGLSSKLSIGVAELRERAIRQTLQVIAWSKNQKDLNALGSDLKLAHVLEFGFANSAFESIVTRGNDFARVALDEMEFIG